MVSFLRVCADVHGVKHSCRCALTLSHGHGLGIGHAMLQPGHQHNTSVYGESIYHARGRMIATAAQVTCRETHSQYVRLPALDTLN